MSQEFEERPYTIPFFPHLKNVPRWKRSKRAVGIVKEFIIKHMKADEVKIDAEVNDLIWSRGNEKPPRKIRVLAERREDDVVHVSLLSSLAIRRERTKPVIFAGDEDIEEEEEEQDVEELTDEPSEENSADSTE